MVAVMEDLYKVKRIWENIDKMHKDPYHLSVLKGGSKDINLDEHALELLSLYYEGRIPEEKIRELALST